MHRSVWRTQAAEHGEACWRIVRLVWRQREHHDRWSIRGNPMKLGGPATPGLADGLRTFFQRARAIGMHLHNDAVQGHGLNFDTYNLSCCGSAKTRSSTPLSDQRFMRV